MTSGSALIPNSGPDGSLPPSSSRMSGGSISLYEVREGDSLSAIADMFGVTTNTILWANDIKDAKSIHAGDTLLILPVSGVKHTVLKGETLAGIAKKYDADADDIALYNGADTTLALTAGDTLIIPGGDLNHETPAKPAAKKTVVKQPAVKATAKPVGKKAPAKKIVPVKKTGKIVSAKDAFSAAFK